MMMKQKLFILLSMVFIFGACSSIKVTADYDASVDFTKYKTYSYMGWSENSTKMLNDFDKRRIEASFASEFNKRGVKYVQTGGDIEVSLYLVTNQKTATTAYTDYYRPRGGYYYGYGWGWGAGYASTSYHQYDYTVGTLVCDVFDGKEKKLVWQSVGSGTIHDNQSTRDKAIMNAVRQMMSLYPIKPSK